MKVGRNDICPCGSGLKYKECCLNWRENWVSRILSHDSEESIKNIVLGVYKFILDYEYQGGCHLISAILYILISEKGYSPSLKLGEVKANDILFDHSWIELDGKVIDIAIMNTLHDDIKLPPVYFSKSLATGAEVDYEYGVSRNIDVTAQLVLAQSIGQYIMAGISQGSIEIMKLVANNAGISLENAEETVSKYMKSYRENCSTIIQTGGGYDV